MNVVHISKEDQDTVFSMLAAVLWLGNISFNVIDNENHINVVPDEGIVLPLWIEWEISSNSTPKPLSHFISILFTVFTLDN